MNHFSQILVLGTEYCQTGLDNWCKMDSFENRVSHFIHWVHYIAIVGIAYAPVSRTPKCHSWMLSCCPFISHKLPELNELNELIITSSISDGAQWAQDTAFPDSLVEFRRISRHQGGRAAHRVVWTRRREPWTFGPWGVLFWKRKHMDLRCNLQMEPMFFHGDKHRQILIWAEEHSVRDWGPLNVFAPMHRCTNTPIQPIHRLPPVYGYTDRPCHLFRVWV